MRTALTIRALQLHLNFLQLHFGYRFTLYLNGAADCRHDWVYLDLHVAARSSMWLQDPACDCVVRVVHLLGERTPLRGDVGTARVTSHQGFAQKLLA
jgi:hypothetical protein